VRPPNFDLASFWEQSVVDPESRYFLSLPKCRFAYRMLPDCRAARSSASDVKSHRTPTAGCGLSLSCLRSKVKRVTLSFAMPLGRGG